MNLNEYADHRKAKGLKGQSHVSVLKAIQAGRLDENAARKDGKRWVINAELADQQWDLNTDPQHRGTGKPGPAPPIADGVMSMQAPSMPGQKGVPNLSYSKAVREAYMARLAAVQWERETKARVLRSEVEKQAFELARQVREAIMNVPDRLAHDLAVMSDSTTIHIALTQALTEALEQLANG